MDPSWTFASIDAVLDPILDPKGGEQIDDNRDPLEKLTMGSTLYYCRKHPDGIANYFIKANEQYDNSVTHHGWSRETCKQFLYSYEHIGD